MADEIPQWNCSRCGSAFTPAPWMVKASFRQCPECKRVYEREYRAKRKAAGNPIVTPAEPNETRRLRYRRKSADPQWRQERNAAARARYAADPGRRQKVNARRRTNEAIASGRLTRQPCEVCGAAPAEAHHDDYSKPLEVRWLCRTHHREHHKGEAA